MIVDPMRVIIAATIICLASGDLRAAIQLPLQGWFRAGKCMPVFIDSSDASATLSSDGIVPTHVASGHDGVVPVLVLSTAARELDQHPLRALAPNQRLVGMTIDAPDLLTQLFAAETVVPIRLDPARPLSGPMLAWEALDAVILEAPPRPAQLPELLSLGVAIVVRSDSRPNEQWPWEQLGNAWVLRPNLAGPIGSTGGESAYLAALGWRPTMSASLRRQIVLAGAICALLIMATLLVRTRRAIVLTLMVALLCCVAIEWWRRAQPATRSAQAQVMIARGPMTQVDAWQYVVAARETVERTTSRPIIIDPGHASRCELKLGREADGGLKWQFKLAPGNRMVLLNRRMRVGTETPVIPDAKVSPLYELARQSYLAPGEEIQGAIPAPVTSDEGWLGILISSP
jgi:hypothetical protein